MKFDLRPLDSNKLPTQLNRPLSSKAYLTYGASLMVVKYVVDSLASALIFHHPWSVLDYFLPGVLNDFSAMTVADAHFYLMMLGIALPFAYIGCVLTVRRLRTLGLPPYLVLLFYVPFINMIFFTVLSLVKSSTEAIAQLPERNSLGPSVNAIGAGTGFSNLDDAGGAAGDTPHVLGGAVGDTPPASGGAAGDTPQAAGSTGGADFGAISKESPGGGGLPQIPNVRAVETGMARGNVPEQTKLTTIGKIANGFIHNKLAVRVLDRLPSDTRVGLVASALLPIPVSVLAALFSVSILHTYGWGVFVAIPFAASISSVIIYAWKKPRTYIECLLCSMICMFGMASMLLIIPFEGIICLLMASPIAVGIAAVGGSIGYLIQTTMPRDENLPRLLGCFAFLVPMLMVAEYLSPPEIPLYVNTSSIIIDAPPQVVWRYLIDFPEMGAPREWVFRTGIAYPIRARIDGRGPGAVRHCIFSTGEFVEPIEVWNEPRLLKFGVLLQAPPMHELSFYSNLHPPHLDNYLVSRNGQFLLTNLPNGRTLLAGTTWYQNYMGPSPYWRLWADWIIHRIHMRVLEHVKNLAEHSVEKPTPLTLRSPAQWPKEKSW